MALGFVMVGYKRGPLDCKQAAFCISSGALAASTHAVVKSNPDHKLLQGYDSCYCQFGS